jgi:tetratricopeptide (TPR) repeat protein
MEYKRALEYDTSATILNAIAESYFRLGKYQLARDYFEKTLKLDPGSENAQERMADIYVRESRYEEAVPLLEQLLQKEAANIGLMRMLAESYRKTGQYEKAIGVLDRMIALRPGIPWAYIYAAEILFASGRPEAASAYLGSVTAIVPPNDDLYEFRVRTLYQAGETGKLNTVLKDWMDTGPGDPAPYLMYADLQLQKGNPDSARRALSRIPETGKEDGRVPYLQGIAAMLEDREDSVRMYFERADKLPAAERELYHDYALWFWERGDLAYAEYIAGRAVQRYGKEPRWLHMTALIERQKGDLRKSRELLRQVLDADPGNRVAKEELANVYMELGEAGKTDSLYAELLAASPGDPGVLNNYAFTLAENGRKLEEAMKMVDKALEQRKNAAYSDTKSWIYYRQGKYPKALRWIKKALQYSGVSSEILYHQGSILRELQRYEQAREAFREALRIDPGNRPAIKALEEMP